MKVVIQRVLRASVTADGAPAGKCGRGLLLLVGVVRGDADADAEILAAKIAKMRIFTDEAGKMNRSLLDNGGSVLAVSNFTLAADISHGNRPSFTDAEKPDDADRLYEYFCTQLRAEGVPVETGVFGAEMRIDMTADGPVTILADSEFWKTER